MAGDHVSDKPQRAVATTPTAPDTTLRETPGDAGASPARSVCGCADGCVTWCARGAPGAAPRFHGVMAARPRPEQEAEGAARAPEPTLGRGP